MRVAATVLAVVLGVAMFPLVAVTKMVEALFVSFSTVADTLEKIWGKNAASGNR